jgi:hypothetical protein
MKKSSILLLSLWMAGQAAHAQVSVELVLDQEQYLRDEPLPIRVRVTNRSGQPLRLGADNSWLRFSIENIDQSPPAPVGRVSDVSVSGEFTVESAQVATRLVDLVPAFDLGEPGRYQVTATVSIRQWNDEITSRPRPFEIVRGVKLWEQEFGVSVKEGPPEARKYILQQARCNKNLMLYLRLTDLAGERIFRVAQLGPMVSFGQPEAQLDRPGYLHVLVQSGARSFLFSVVSPEGDLVLRQTYDYSTTRPTLRGNDEGHIFVQGGARRIQNSDIPASPSMGGAALLDTNALPTLSATNATNSATHAATNAPVGPNTKPAKP